MPMRLSRQSHYIYRHCKRKGTGEMNVVLAELQPLILARLQQELVRAGMTPLICSEPEDLLEFVLENEKVLVIYDADLIDETKHNFYHKIRQVQGVPMIALIARRTEFNRENGRHIRVIKPFEISEVLIHCQQVRTLLLNTQLVDRDEQQYLIHGDLCIDFAGHEVRYQNQPLKLSAKEFAVLCHLAKQPNQAMSREALLSEIWGSTRTASDVRTVDHQIKGLRKKLACVQADVEITTVYREGYQLTLISSHR